MALPVTLACRGVRVSGTTLDLGVGGAFIETLLEPAFDAPIEVTLQAPAAVGHLRLPALVRWKKTGGIGVQFLELGARETYTLASLIKAARGRSGVPYLDVPRLAGKEPE
jgi:hypothetical protein